MLRKVLFPFSVITVCGAYHILVVFPLPGKSHTILGEGFVHTLLNAGHQVTYITPLLMKNVSANLRQIDVSTNFNLMPTEEILNIEKITNKEVDLYEMLSMFHLMIAIANGTIMHKNVQQLLHDPNEDFDAVIIEWMYTEIYAGFASVFECPMIWSSSMDPHYLVTSLIDEDLNPAYTTDIYSNETPPFNFRQRLSNLFFYFQTRIKKWLLNGLEVEIFEKAYGPAATQKNRNLPPYNEVKYNASLMLGNSHVAAGQSVRLPQNYIPIAGYHIDTNVKPLSSELKRIMDNAKNGVIYFSMGSLLKSTQIPKPLKESILDMFGALNQTVIWKFEEKIDNLPKNVHIVQWAPQQSILAHPRCVIFITHGGLLSTTETLHFGVPIIGIPMFADQFNNVNRAKDKGFAKRVDLDLETPVKLKAAIDDILGSPRYRERVKELSLIYHDRPVSPRAALVHWVEHVVRTRGAQHLRSPALYLAWYQKMYIDFVVVLIATLTIAICTLRIVFKNSNIDKIKKN